MSSRRVIRTDRAPAAIGPYSQAVWDEAAGLLYCSGQIGIDPAKGELVAGGVVPECRQALRNCVALLEAAGLVAADVVRVTLFLSDMQDFAAVNAIYAEVFAEPFPARSTVAAAGLPKGARVEIECTALAAAEWVALAVSALRAICFVALAPAPRRTRRTPASPGLRAPRIWRALRRPLGSSPHPAASASLLWPWH